MSGTEASAAPAEVAALRRRPWHRTFVTQARSLVDAEHGQELLLVVVLVMMALFFWHQASAFGSITNIRNVIGEVSVLGLLSLPVTYLMVAGSIDISGAGVAAFSGVLFAKVSDAGAGSVTTAVIVVIIAGIAAGAANGVLVVTLGVNPIISTLGTLTVWEGAADLASNGQTISLSGFRTLGGNLSGGVPLQSVIFVGLALLMMLTLRKTVMGRHLRAIGSNSEAARLVGVNAKPLLFVVFVCSGAFASLAGLILASELGAAAPTSGTDLDLFIVAAIVLGGASLRGAKGSIEGTFLGVLILGVLQNGLVIINVSSFWGQIVEGAVLIVAVATDRLRSA